MTTACCLFCSLFLLPIQNAYQLCCYWRLLMGYDFLLCSTARCLCHFDTVVISFLEGNLSAAEEQMLATLSWQTGE